MQLSKPNSDPTHLCVRDVTVSCHGLTYGCGSGRDRTACADPRTSDENPGLHVGQKAQCTDVDEEDVLVRRLHASWGKCDRRQWAERGHGGAEGSRFESERPIKERRLCLRRASHMSKKSLEGCLIKHLSLQDLAGIQIDEARFYKPAADTIRAPTNDFRFDPADLIVMGCVEVLFLERHHDAGSGHPTLVRDEIETALTYVANFAEQRGSAGPTISDKIVGWKPRRSASIGILSLGIEPEEKSFLQTALSWCCF